jgi:hypothetical protein
MSRIGTAAGAQAAASGGAGAERGADARATGERAAAAHFRAAVETIDAAFGEGYARAHPELVASLVQASAIEAAVGQGREAHEETLSLVERLSREMQETILKLKPRLFG